MRLSAFRILAISLLSLTFFIACDRNSFKVNITDIPKPEVQIHDYGTALFTLNRDSLGQELTKIQNEFSLFLGTEPLIDEQIIQLRDYINDPFLNDLYTRYKTVFPSLVPLEDDLAQAFQHELFYYPNTPLPEVYTYISGARDPIIFQDNILVIGLDNYLGADCEIYARMGTPRYIMHSMTSEFVMRDVTLALSLDKIIAPEADAAVLDYMLYEAKKLYFVKSMIPTIEDTVLLNYTEEQLNWFSDNESELWKYYIENELLFKSDYESIKKFINDAPFTSVLGNNSPSRTGVWLGYQILLSYSKNNDVSLSDILSNTNGQEILNKSKYKPKR